jgi:hypothetical protein
VNLSIIDVLLKVVETLEKVGIPYLVGGSLASSLYGIARSTQDVDLLALIRPDQAANLASELQGEFYADPKAILKAVTLKGSFNVIHLASAFKVDVFVARNNEYDAAQLARREQRTVSTNPIRTVFVASPEDTILSKLVWYRKGEEISDQQWRDVRGVIEAKGGTLDLAYLRRWAVELGVLDLLDRALAG